MVPNQHLLVLTQIVAALQRIHPAWVITGSTGMALQGVPLEPHDIDLQTSQAGVYAIQRALARTARVVTPVRFCETNRIRSHLGALVIDGLAVEIMGGLQKRLSDGSWEKPVPVRAHRRWVTAGSLRLPVLSLEYEYQAYLTLGRIERAAILRDFLDHSQSAALSNKDIITQ